MIVTLIIIIVMAVMNYTSVFCINLSPSLGTDAIPAEELPKSCSYSSLVTVQ